MTEEPATPPAVDVQSLSRSCNELLILSILASGPHHGYQLALELEQRSEGAFRFRHGTLYPILHQLERDGLIEGGWSAASSGRRRKSYQLTLEGRGRLAEGVRAWRGFFHSFFSVVEEEVRP